MEEKYKAFAASNLRAIVDMLNYRNILRENIVSIEKEKDQFVVIYTE